MTAIEPGDRAKIAFPAWRDALAWSLAALLLGFILRAILLWQMPSAFYHPDSASVFDTCRALINQHALHLHPKKTALAPAMYCLPYLLHIPVLPAIAIVQHGLGLGLIYLVSLFIRQTFRFWRFFVLPVSIVVALDPVLLWYEHLCLPECWYVFLVVALACAGVQFCATPSRRWLSVFLVVSFVLTAARPEAKLWALFTAALIVATYWRQSSRRAVALAGALLFVGLCFALNKTAQSGSILYSNVAHLTGVNLRSAPGFRDENRAHFEELERSWAIVPRKIPRERKVLQRMAKAYLQSRGSAEDFSSRQIEKFCGKVATETCLRSVWKLPELALNKFRYGLREPTAEDFGPHWLFRKQPAAFLGQPDDADEPIEDDSSADVFTNIVLGHDFSSSGELTQHLHAVYRPFEPDWLSGYNTRFQEGMIAWRLPDRVIEGTDVVRGMPFLFIAAILGMLSFAIPERRLVRFHSLWMGAMIAMAFVLALTGSNKGRFRIVFEPFWFVYAAALGDSLLLWLRHHRAGAAANGPPLMQP